MPAATTALVAESMLSWINDQLREELARREVERLSVEVPREFWRLQAIRLVSFSVAGLCWLALNLALGV